VFLSTGIVHVSIATTVTKVCKCRYIAFLDPAVYCRSCVAVFLRFCG